MSNPLLIVIGIAALLILLYIAVKISKKDDKSDSDKESLLLIRQQEERLERTRREINDLLRSQNELLNKQFSDTNKSMQNNFMISQRSVQQQLKDSVQSIESVTKELTSIKKTNEQVADLAKQMDSLEKILKNPKQRGVLGEYFLETTLKNVLPPESFQMQYKFNNGEIVDAVVFVKDKIVPIDSKFSLENYNRIATEDDPVVREGLEKEFKNDLKKRIDETSKYIRPDEGTMEFAFMFIPSEGIYYDLLVNKVGALKVNTADLISYAFTEKNVIIVSPTSFLAYLQTVLQGLRMLKIEESALQIKENVSKLAKHIKAYDEYFAKVGKHLGTTVNAYNSANKELNKIDKDVLNISGESMELTAEDVEKEY
ncbi:DNA recombination protein RmuC [Candidatus Dojkabacteria bacterium]|uniref:DNA recombination protein RmuC n=1 Tax=Candidatus Dojkabacteria bacterium TaxID=2099670 RepID=A0A955L141_9BACT|nr:DNA recombination protein RmuC [Candidatus Dojkabacteria bacterium]